VNSTTVVVPGRLPFITIFKCTVCVQCTYQGGPEQGCLSMPCRHAQRDYGSGACVTCQAADFHTVVSTAWHAGSTQISQHTGSLERCIVCTLALAWCVTPSDSVPHAATVWHTQADSVCVAHTCVCVTHTSRGRTAGVWRPSCHGGRRPYSTV
jgi:hypothetical protein